MSTTTALTDRVSSVASRPKAILRVEGGGLLVAAVVGYAQLDVSWWMFAVLFLVPDLGLLGYVASGGVGATSYNLTHTLSLPLLLGATSLAVGWVTAGAVALIWLQRVA